MFAQGSDIRNGFCVAVRHERGANALSSIASERPRANTFSRFPKGRLAEVQVGRIEHRYQAQLDPIA